MTSQRNEQVRERARLASVKWALTFSLVSVSLLSVMQSANSEEQAVLA